MSLETEKVGFTVLWSIENFHYCTLQTGEMLQTPPFFVETMNKTGWHLKLYPRGEVSDTGIGYYLWREFRDTEPDTIAAGFKLSFLDHAGSALISTIPEKRTFRKGDGWGTEMFAKRGEVLGDRRSEFLPGNTLTVRCHLWRNGRELSEGGMCRIRTRFGVEHRAFSWNIDHFETLQIGHKKVISLKPAAKKISPFHFVLCLAGESIEDGKLHIKISRSDTHSRIILTCKVSAISSNGESIDSAEDEHVFEKTSGKHIWHFPTFLSKRDVMAKKSLYLSNGALSLRCKCSISDGRHTSDIQSIVYGSPSYIKAQSCSNPSPGTDTQKDATDSTSLRNDLQYLYEQGILCDVKLQADSQSFPAHKNILSARSPVFKAMFTGDMLESANDTVQIEDVEADVLKMLLLYIYTDRVEGMEWDRAGKLFSAADKYSILSLRTICSSILKTRLCRNNACEILSLAHLHQDMDLKKAVQDYILSGDSDIFDTDEWENFMKVELQLAAETMRLKWTKK